MPAGGLLRIADRWPPGEDVWDRLARDEEELWERLTVVPVVGEPGAVISPTDAMRSPTTQVAVLVAFCCRYCKAERSAAHGQIMGAAYTIRGVSAVTGRMTTTWWWSKAKSAHSRDGVLFGNPEPLTVDGWGEEYGPRPGERWRMACRVSRHTQRSLTPQQIIGQAERAAQGGFEFLHV